MFVCSDSGVYLYNLQSRDKEIRINLDTMQSPVGCCALQTGHNEGHFMVGRDDAVYCYTSDGRGPCYALDGKKTLLQWFRSHLLIVSKNTRVSGSNGAGFVLTVIDIQNKFIVYTCPIDEVAAILTEFGSCYILTENKQIFHLDEKDLQSKLNLLFKKNLYDIAVRIAKSNQYDADGLAGIFKQYGDHLYSKGDFSGSVDQYTKTIGFLEPSYVIRRFLDARHIHYLTDYLQAIHKSGRASADHTTLLLNCFTRLDRTEQLKQFLENENKLNLFDVDVAIKVCRNASVEQALALAKAHGKHDLCLSILTEDLCRYEDALKYISQLDFHEAERNVKKYGFLLMEHCPGQTIALLKKLCTDYVRTDLGTSALQDHFGGDDLTSSFLLENGLNSERGNPEDFVHLFSNSELLIDFLEHLILNLPSCSKFVYNSLIERYLHRWREEPAVERKLLDTLKQNADRYDKSHVLIQCRVHQFWPGVMYLYEEDKLHHLIVRHYLKNRDYENLLACCRKLGQSDASLWLLALNGLKNDQAAPPKLLSQVLQVIGEFGTSSSKIATFQITPLSSPRKAASPAPDPQLPGRRKRPHSAPRAGLLHAGVPEGAGRNAPRRGTHAQVQRGVCRHQAAHRAPAARQRRVPEHGLRHVQATPLLAGALFPLQALVPPGVSATSSHMLQVTNIQLFVFKLHSRLLGDGARLSGVQQEEHSADGCVARPE